MEVSEQTDTFRDYIEKAERIARPARRSPFHSFRNSWELFAAAAEANFYSTSARLNPVRAGDKAVGLAQNPLTSAKCRDFVVCVTVDLHLTTRIHSDASQGDAPAWAVPFSHHTARSRSRSA